MIVQLVVYLPRTQIDLHFPRSAPQNKAFLFQAKQGAPFGLQVPTQMANSWVNTPVLELSDVIHSSLGHFLRGLANSSWWQTSYNFKVQVGSFTGKIWWSMIQNHPIFLIQPIHSNLTLFFSKKNETNHQPTIHTSHPHPKKRKKNAKKKNEASRFAARLPIPRLPVGPTTNSKSSCNPSPAWPQFRVVRFRRLGRTFGFPDRWVFLLCVEWRSFLKTKNLVGLT